MRFLFIISTLLTLSTVFCQKQADVLAIFEKEEKEKKHFVIRVSPSFFWSTFGVEAERGLGKSTSLGLHAFVSIGAPLDNDPLRKAAQTDVKSQGAGIDLVFKKYFTPTFDGFFVYGLLSYNTIEYFRRDKKPFTVISTLTEEKENDIIITNPSDKKTLPYGGGFGVGYQYMIIPKHLMINLEGGVLGFATITNEPFFSLYISPSIGYKF
ncbi:MAG: hypothetical protein AB8B61_04100 [Cyclobacteriaceae bacterium]